MPFKRIVVPQLPNGSFMEYRIRMYEQEPISMKT